jgi:DNA repair exonuclease SbcCD ATPase subunit
LGEIERLNGLIAEAEAANEDTTNLEGELATAEGETQGLRDARDAAQEALNPVLLAQGMDEYYLASGLEYVAYENWKTAGDQLERSREALAEAEEELPHLEEELAAAEYELNLAADNARRDEYEHAAEVERDVRARYDAQAEKQRIAREQVDQLEPETEQLKSDWTDATTDREAQARRLKDEADVDVEPFDPAEGPPSLPEEEDSTDDGSDTNAGDATTTGQ